MKILLTTLATITVVSASLPQFSGSYSDSIDGHRQFGLDVGSKFKNEINERIANNEVMQKVILPFIKGGESTALMKQLQQTHKEKYPLYFAEIEGMASGASLRSEELFAMNLKQEITMLINSTDPNEQCSDYSLSNTICHNEDSEKSDVGKTGLLNVTFGGNNFIAYTYLGDLPSGAFGFTPGNVAFSLNRVSPATAVSGGYGRGFISRDLLATKSWEGALSVVKTSMIGGHNYQLMNIKTGDVTVAEIGHSMSKFHDIRLNEGKPFFHANHYLLLDIPQIIDSGSIARVNRAKQLPSPQNVFEALTVLGDQANSSYPVFHDSIGHKNGDITGLWTLQTVVFDWTPVAATMTIFQGNPKNREIILAMRMN